jgi:hypothetical protein
MCTGDSRQVDADTADVPYGRKSGERFARAAAQIDHERRRPAQWSVGGRGDYGVEVRAANSGREECRTCFDGLAGIARIAGSAVLRLQQVDVPFARDIERMPVVAAKRTITQLQTTVTPADGAN